MVLIPYPGDSSQRRSTVKVKEQDALPSYLFHQGTNYRAHEYLGAHRDGENLVFRVWAPNADTVSVVGDFNNWNSQDTMTRVTDGGIWETRIPATQVPSGSRYKFRIVHSGNSHYKADPYGRYAEKKPATASVYLEESPFVWHDEAWLHRRAEKAPGFYSEPMNIYEVHAGSWRRHEDGSYFTYRELADTLIPYATEMGYTHIEFLPLAEHPFDGSWGYQVCGYYAPTSRFGTPNELRYLIDCAHAAGLGIILDWVPAHFPKDEHGLCEFDGAPLYEYQGKDRQEHKAWGTRCFDLGRNEVQCFLISNLAYFAEEFHVDGFRVDAVASMLYLDYDRGPGEWVPNVRGTNISLEAVAFFRKLNREMKHSFPDVLMIAEESTAFPDITRFDREGLGFDLKWNMGWMNDALSYAATDPLFRSGCHNKLTFPLCYAFSEKFILPISHDEVVHGKRSLLDRMPGEYEAKFAQTRLFYTYMMTTPGKKLTFMGMDIGQFREWDCEGQIEWFLLDYDQHNRLHRFVRELNAFYRDHAALWQRDDTWDGFEWLLADCANESIYAYLRRGNDGKELIVLLNFTPVERKAFRLPLPAEGRYTLCFSSVEKRFGAPRVLRKRLYCSEPVESAGRRQSLLVNLPPFAAMIFEKID